MKKRYYLYIILLFSLTIRLYFFVGFNLNDDLVYLNFAHQISTGKFELHPYIFAVRLLMNYPIAIFFMLFGPNDYSAAAYILLTSLGSVLVAFYLGKTLFDENAGLIAALLMSFFPIEVAYATTIVPDVPVAFYMGLSVLLFVLGEKKGDVKYSYLAGVAIGFAGLVKSLGLLIFLFFGAYFLIERIFSLKRQQKVRQIKFSIKYSMVCLALITLLAISLKPDLIT